MRELTVPRDSVVVSGPEAISYLQGQLSQDVADLAEGASIWSWVLQPTGKVEALVRVTRTGPDSLVADTDDGWGEALLKRLTFYKLRTKVDLSLQPGAVLVRRGPEATAAGSAEPAGRAVTALWPVDQPAADVLLAEPPAAIADHEAADAEAWEAARVAAGVPAMGAELTERTIPNETGLVGLTVSFSKGCYTGQELIVRIDSRGGNVARHLRRLRSASPLAVGEELVAAGKVVGTVTSAADSPEHGPVGLAYVARSVVPGDQVTVGETAVTVVEVALGVHPPG